jgi:hypothetical protein
MRSLPCQKAFQVWRKDHRNLGRIMLTYGRLLNRAGQAMRKFLGTAAILTVFATSAMAADCRQHVKLSGLGSTSIDRFCCC